MPADKPLPPEVLANALQERIHATSGRLLSAVAVFVRVPMLPTDHALEAEVDALVEAQCGKHGKRTLERR